MNLSESEVVSKIKSLRDSVDFEDEAKENTFYQKNNTLFSFVSANLLRLFPQISFSKHRQIFKELLINLKLIYIEEENPTVFAPHFQIKDPQNVISRAKAGEPFLFCCFHLGAYSLLPTLLTYKNLNFGFLLNQKLMDKKGQKFKEAHRKLSEHISQNQKNTSSMELVNVEETKGIWKAIRLLKNGKSLVIYADGNTGATKNSIKDKNSQNNIELTFLGEKLSVRQGIVFLSRLCSVPIVPVISSRDSVYDLKRKYEFLKPIFPDKSPSKEDFAKKTLQKLYKILEFRIQELEKISEWEGWLFVNTFFKEMQKHKKNEENINKKGSVLDISQKYVFNFKEFSLIENQKTKQITLFDKRYYRFFPVSEALHQTIIYFSEAKKLYSFGEHQEYVLLTGESEAKKTTSTQGRLSNGGNRIPLSALSKLIERRILVQFRQGE